MRTRSRGGPGRRAAAVLLAATALLGAAAAPASAHDALVSSSPADGASVPTPPTRVVLTFEEAPLTLGAQVRVTGPGGAVVSTGEPQLAQDAVTERLAGDLPAGRYEVAWRVTSDDGHPISGTFSYTASAGAAPAPSSSTPGSSTPGSSTPSPSASGSPAAGAASSGSGGGGGSSAWLPWAGGAVVLAAGAAVLVRRRRSTTA